MRQYNNVERFRLALLGCVLLGLTRVWALQPMPIMTAVGCVDNAGRGEFLVVNATVPLPLEERMPEAPRPDAPLGDLTIRLVGTLEEFGVANYGGHKVWVKGLLNSTEPHDLLNLTSITSLSSTCK